MKSELEALGRGARTLLEPGPTGAAPAAFLDRADGTTRRRRVRIAVSVAGLTLVSLVAGWAATRGRPEEPRVVEAPVVAPASPSRVLTDGTVLDPEPSAVLEVTESPAPVVRLARGRVVVRTTAAAPTTLSLGRWVVHLTSSARFAAESSSSAGSLLVLEGEVEVRAGDVRRVVRAGERVALEEEAPFAPAAPPSGSASTATPVRPWRPPAPPPPSPESRPGAAPTPSPSWSEWVAEGRSAAVLEAALPRLEEVLGSEPAAALVALADAARFEQRFDVALRACEAVRARFPGTAEAAHARFTQARLAERRGDVDAARAHYEGYLEDAPGGPLAAEALARRVQLEADRGSSERACALAKEYLERFPTGPLARQFRERCGLE